MNCCITPMIGVSDLHGRVVKVQFLLVLVSVVARIACIADGVTIPQACVGWANARDEFLITHAAGRRHDGGERFLGGVTFPVHLLLSRCRSR
jgi:hypothetical protein